LAERNGEAIKCGLRATYQGSCVESVDVDYVIFATGYHIELDPRLITKLQKFFVHGDDGRLVSGRQYRISTTRDFLPRVFALGINEATHGIGDTLLSNMAVRASEVVNALELDRRDETHASAQIQRG
jgi:L-ornithine N5-oxygenase